DDRVRRTVDESPGGEASERPNLRFVRTCLRDARREHRGRLRLDAARQVLERARDLPHLAELLRSALPAAQLALAPCARREEQRADLLIHRLLLRFAEPAGDALPGVPPLGADLRRVRRRGPAIEEPPEELDAPGIALLTEARTEEEAGEVQ